MEGGQHGSEDVAGGHPLTSCSLAVQCYAMLLMAQGTEHTLQCHWRGWHCCDGSCKVPDVMEVTPLHRDLDSVHGNPAQQTAGSQSWPPLDAAKVEHAVAWSCICNVLSHTATDGTCPCICHSYGLLTAAGGVWWAALLHQCCNSGVRGREVTVTHCPRVCQRHSLIL